MLKKMFTLTEEIENALDDYVRKQKGRERSMIVRQALWGFLTARGYELKSPKVKRGRQTKQEQP